MDSPVTCAADGLERRAFTIADLERMVEAGIVDPDERLELLDGEIVPMAAKGLPHELIKSALNLLWGRTCPLGFAFIPETGLRLDRYTYLEPDFVVFARTVRLANLKGPDVLLAVEVADASLSYDLRRKPHFYARFGVRELWVVEVGRRVIHRHTEPADGRYARIERSGAGERLVPAHAPADFAFALDELENL